LKETQEIEFSFSNFEIWRRLIFKKKKVEYWRTCFEIKWLGFPIFNCPIPSNSVKSRAIPSNSAQFREIPRNSPLFRGIPRNSAQFRAIPRNSLLFRAIPSYSTQFRATLSNSEQFVAILQFRNSVQFCNSAIPSNFALRNPDCKPNKDVEETDYLRHTLIF